MTPKAEQNAKRQKQLDWSGRQNLLRRWLTDDTHVKHLLRVLFDHTPVGETDCFLLVDTICREMSITSRRTVQRAIKKAKEDGLLIVFGPGAKRRCNTYRLRMANIFDAAKSELKGDTMSPQGCQIVTPVVPNSHPKGDTMSPISSSEVKIEPPPPKCNAGETPVAAHPADEWAVVVEELIDYGVQSAEPAADKARQNGCSAPFVRRVIDSARMEGAADGTKAWGPGGLRRRILNLRPGQAIDDKSLWLPPSPEYQAARRREAGQQQRSQARESDRTREETKAKDAAAAAECEQLCGAVLDGMPRDEVYAMAWDIGGTAFLASVKKKGYSDASSTNRKQLLLKLKEQLSSTQTE